MTISGVYFYNKLFSKVVIFKFSAFKFIIPILLEALVVLSPYVYDYFYYGGIATEIQYADKSGPYGILKEDIEPRIPITDKMNDYIYCGDKFNAMKIVVFLARRFNRQYIRYIR